MRVTEGNAVNIQQPSPQVEETVDTAEISRYVPDEDPLAKWLALFTHINFSVNNPEISVAARVVSRLIVIPVKDPRVCPMMAVGIRRGKYTLMYNPEWLKIASFTEVKATLVHEAYHILLRDIPRFMTRLALFSREKRGRAHRVMNVALDAANNTLMRERMPYMAYGSTGYWILPPQLKLSDKQSSEYYFEILLQKSEEDQKKFDDALNKALQDLEDGEEGDDAGGSGAGGEGNEEGEAGEESSSLTVEDIAKAVAKLIKSNAHDWDGDSATTKKEMKKSADQPSMSPEELEAQAAELDAEAKRLAKRALKDQRKRQGTLPSHMQALLDSLLDDGEIPWTTYLRSLVAARVSSTKLRTTKYFNKKRYLLFEEDEEGVIKPLPTPIPQFPGIEVERTFVIMWALDTSGSMSEDDIRDGLSELQGLVRADPNIHVIVVQCDVDISNVSILSADDTLEEYIKDVGRTSCGGTSFAPPFNLEKYILDKSVGLPGGTADSADVEALLRDYACVDLIVYHTDGYAYAPPFAEKPRCPTIWCLTKEGGRTPSVEGGGELFGTIIER